MPAHTYTEKPNDLVLCGEPALEADPEAGVPWPSLSLLAVSSLMEGIPEAFRPVRSPLGPTLWYNLYMYVFKE